MLFLRVDWGERHHDLCLLDQDGMVLAARWIADPLAGVAEFHALLATHVLDPARLPGHRVTYQEQLAWPVAEPAA
jgi:hypothetical protein